MGLEQRNEEHYREPVDKYADPIVSYQMTTRDYVLRPSAPNGAIVITLPPVADAQGRWYSIIARSASAIRTITIADKDDSECWTRDIVLNGKCDRCLLYSDGLAWHVMANPGEWPGGATRIPGTNAPTVAPTTLPN